MKQCALLPSKPSLQYRWVDIYKSWGERLAVPLLRLRLQGCPKVNMMSAQLADVFQVLAKAVAVPSTNPLRPMKSSLIFLLKLPHKPVGVQFNQKQTNLDVKSVYFKVFDPFTPCCCIWNVTYFRFFKCNDQRYYVCMHAYMSYAIIV